MEPIIRQRAVPLLLCHPRGGILCDKAASTRSCTFRNWKVHARRWLPPFKQQATAGLHVVGTSRVCVGNAMQTESSIGS